MIIKGSHFKRIERKAQKKSAEEGFEYKGYTYKPEWDDMGEYIMGNDGSYEHIFIAPDGNEIRGEFWSRTPPSEEAIMKWIDLGLPSRQTVSEGMRANTPLSLDNLTDYEKRMNGEHE